MFDIFYKILYENHDMAFLYRISYHLQIVCTSKYVFNVKMQLMSKIIIFSMKMLFFKTFLREGQI